MNVKDKADNIYNFEKMGSITNSIEQLKRNSSKKNYSFGAPFILYEKSMVLGAKTHYYGKGN